MLPRMPKLIDVDPEDELKTAEQRVKEELSKTGGLLILFRIREHQVDYSIMNRPEPASTMIDDHLLSTALVEAVVNFAFKRVKRSAVDQREKVSRSDGRTVTYKESVSFDWNSQTIESTVKVSTMRGVMAIVVDNLMQNAMRQRAQGWPQLGERNADQ